MNRYLLSNLRFKSLEDYWEFSRDIDSITGMFISHDYVDGTYCAFLYYHDTHDLLHLKLKYGWAGRVNWGDKI